MATQVWANLLHPQIIYDCCLVAKSCPTHCDPWTVAHQTPPSMGFPRQEYWSGLPFPSPGDLLDPGIEFTSPALQVDSLKLSQKGSPHLWCYQSLNLPLATLHCDFLIDAWGFITASRIKVVSHPMHLSWTHLLHLPLLSISLIIIEI